MGIDGSHKLTILGPKRILDDLERNRLCFPLSQEQQGNDFGYLQRHYFQEGLTLERRTDRVLFGRFDFRNQPVDFYLEELARNYPECWIKDEWHTEVGWCGFWIGHVKADGTLSVQRHEWEELGWEEAHYWGAEKDTKDSDIEMAIPSDTPATN
jgi:hypothetical protein